MKFNDAKKFHGNKSKLSYAECLLWLLSTYSFESMLEEDLEALYFAAFKRWPYQAKKSHLLDALTKYREKTLCLKLVKLS